MIKQEVVDWLHRHGVIEVEVLFPDFTGIPRGKIIPTEKFVLDTVKLPESVIAQSVTGEWGLQEDFLSAKDNDMQLVPDVDGCFPVPWGAEEDSVAQVICDCYSIRNRPVSHAPRTLLKRVVGLFRRRGWFPVVAPEIEFYVVRHDSNPDNPLQPPIGRSQWPVGGQQPFSIDAVNEYEPMVNDIYAFAEQQELAIDTLNHEEGIAQMEINFKHGDPVAMADQVLMFKRCVRESALRHNIRATFMAKPIADQPGSSLHIHQSVNDRNGDNLFADADGGGSPMMSRYLAGLQRHAQALQPIYMPNINSYRRMNSPRACVNTQWGVNNRSVGFRVPETDAASARRIENRLPGADVNPYLAIGASLLSGYLGMVGQLRPTEECRGAGWEQPPGLHTDMVGAVQSMQKSEAVRKMLGGSFVNLFTSVKLTEYGNYRRVVSSWERMYLLQTV